MFMMKAQDFLDSLPGAKRENLRAWLAEVARGLKSEDRIELVMHHSWWTALEALYHASYNVDDAGKLLVLMQLHATAHPRLKFREVVEEQAPKKAKAARVKKHDAAQAVVEEGGKHDLPIA